MYSLEERFFVQWFEVVDPYPPLIRRLVSEKFLKAIGILVVGIVS